MLALRGRAVMLAGLLATACSASALANDTVTTQQTVVGEAVTEVAVLEPRATVAKKSYATETNGRPANPLPPSMHLRQPARSEAYRPARRYVDRGPRSCTYLGCRGVHVLGVGF